MGIITRGRELARGLGVPRLLLGAALGAFGSLLLGALSSTASAWASESSTESTGLAVVTNPLAAEISETSRLAARLVPHIQQGYGASAVEGAVQRLVSDLTEPVDDLMRGTADAVATVSLDDTAADLPVNETVVDDAAGMVTPLTGAVSSIAKSPAPLVSSVNETVAPSTDAVDIPARWVTDGREPPVSGVSPGDATVTATARGQRVTAIPQSTADSAERAAALIERAPGDRSAAALADSASLEPASHDASYRYPSPEARQPWALPGPRLPDLNVIPGGATGHSTGATVDSGKSAVDTSSTICGEQVSFARTVIGELGRHLDRAAELSVAPD